jgi:hypothetical protein
MTRPALSRYSNSVSPFVGGIKGTDRNKPLTPDSLFPADTAYTKTQETDEVTQFSYLP